VIVDLVKEGRRKVVGALDEANVIVPLYNRELTEYDRDGIREDKISRGESVDD